jgi:hypothetical protein
MLMSDVKNSNVNNKTFFIKYLSNEISIVIFGGRKMIKEYKNDIDKMRKDYETMGICKNKYVVEMMNGKLRISECFIGKMIV